MNGLDTEALILKGKALEDRINMIIESGNLSYADENEEVIHECARRYVDAEHRRLERNASRDVERAAKVRQEANAQLRERVRDIVAEMSSELHAEWTKTLLASSFAVGDGTRVTWSAATVEQHTERAQMLEGMASGDLQTAAIHRQAVRDIEAAKVKTLAEVTRARRP
jgi:hypothetical protein